MELVFDLETNGLLEDLDTIHSLCMKDIISKRFWSCVPTYATYVSPLEGVEVILITEGLELLKKAERLIGHNIIKFDIPAIAKVFPDFFVDDRVVYDTLVASRLIWTNLVVEDMIKIRAGKVALLPKLAGSHGLEAWGLRLGEWKGDYMKMMEEKGLDPWASWNIEMQEYCEQDVIVNEKLYELILSKNYSQEAIDLEHGVAHAMAVTERNGYAFNVAKAEALYRDLSLERAEMAENLRSVFKPWQMPNGKPFVPKRDNAKLGYVKGEPIQKYKTVVFNPNSRDHIANRLTATYGWKPSQRTPTGKPKIDEAVLEKLDYPEAKKLARYMMIQKVIGMLAEGDNAWLKLQRNGRIYGSIITNGAVTGRATHSQPNVGAVPSVRKEYGKVCRELFGQKWQIGCDVSGLELRMLGHFMAKHDGGEYARQVIEGDVHTVNQEAAGLPNRDTAKTFIYAFLYGAGNGKIGSIVGKSAAVGGKLRKAFLTKVSALGKLTSGVQSACERRGILKGLDQRDLYIRSSHSALNTLLQSAGALVCKRWIVEFVELLKENDMYQTDVKIVAWVHDELQMEVTDAHIYWDDDFIPNPKKPEEKGGYRSKVGDLCIEAIIRAGNHFNIRVPLDGEYKVGENWADCH